MRDLLIPFRLAFRRLCHRPLFSLTVVAILALCLGANATSFTLLRNTLFRSLPAAHPEQLLTIASDPEFPTVSYPDYRDLRDRNQVLAGLAGFRPVPLAVAGAAQPERTWGYLATGNYFQLLGVRPAAGRLLTPEDDRSRLAHPVVVLSHSYWVRHFSASPGAIGRTLRLNGHDYEIVGVAEPGFFGTELLFRPSLWIPMQMQPQVEPANPWLDRRGSRNLMAIGRLAPGVTATQAESALQAIGAQLAAEYPDVDRGLRISTATPGLFGSMLRGGAARFVALLVGITALVLLVACSNIAGLLLARSTDRTRETAIALALGANRSRLFGEHLAESVLLSAAGGAAGLLLSIWLTDLLAAAVPRIDLPIGIELAPDGAVFALTLASTALTCLLCGAAPALRAGRLPVLEGLKGIAGGAPGRRWQLRDGLVAAQVMLTLVPLSGALLAITGLRQALHMQLGFVPAGAIAARYDLALQGYSPARAAAFDRQLLAALEKHPGVEAAALANTLPLRLEFSAEDIYPEGEELQTSAEARSAGLFQASEGYLAAMGTRLAAGRWFDRNDTADSTPVAVVNRTFVRRFLPPGDPLGRRVRFSQRGALIRIVGVVEDGKYRGLMEQPVPVIFRPFAQDAPNAASLVVRGRLAPADALAAVRSAMAALDASVPLYDAGTLEEHLELALFPSRLAAGILAAMAAVSLCLAAAGVFSLVAYAVSSRTREIGIRMAIGATPWQAIGGLLRRTAILLAAGAGAGVLLSVGAAQALGGILAGSDPRDPAIPLAAALLLLAIAGAATAGPARRAVRLNPLRALRLE